jgi:AcrR family transcriptional regulator
MPRPARAPKPRREPLNRDKIAVAALAFIDRFGLEELSTRRLGRELGVEGMALYKHLPSKEALLDAVAEKMLQELDVPPAKSWKDRARIMASTYRQLAQRHPRAYPLLANRRFNTAHMLGLLERIFASLIEDGLTLAQAVELYRTIGAFANGAMLDELVGYTMKDRAEEFPPELKLLGKAATHLDARSFDRAFEAGLDSLILGFEKRHRLGRD